MKKILPALIIGLILGAAAMWLYTRSTAPAASESTATAAATPAAPEKPNPLQLDAAKRTAAGITLVKSAPATITPQIEGFARVLDTTPLVAMIADIQAARVSLDASQNDLGRTKKLYDAGGNASAQALQTAQAAVARDTAAFNAAQSKLLASWGSDIAQNTNGVINQIMGGATLIRIDLLPGDTPAATLKTALISPLAVTTPAADAIAAQIIGSSPTADPQLQGTSLLALIPANTVSTFSFAANIMLRATLTAAGETTTAPSIPRSAIVFYQGSAWIYVLGEEDTFERKIVTLGRPLPDDRIAITSGLDDPDDQIVSTGAQQLLSAELQAGQSDEGD